MKPWKAVVMPLVLPALLCGIVAGTFFAAVETANEAKCDKRWENSGLNTSYSFWGGCQVRLSSGKWVPEDRVRQSDIIIDEED